jgi:hypothetical protein
MIGDENPGKAGSRGLQKDGSKAEYKMVAISIIMENPSPFDTAADDVMNGARGVYACLSRHAEKLATGNAPAKTSHKLPFSQL